MILPKIHIHPDGHYLAQESGAPFFWLGDTAWNLFHRLDREEALLYFKTRQRQGFNIIQAVALAEQNGLNSSDVYGERPLLDNDPDRPNEAYFSRVFEWIDLAAQHGLYTCLLPTWADKVTLMWGDGPVVFDPAKAYAYGRWLAGRLQDRTHIIWCLGGDRPPMRGESDWRPVWRAMADGIRNVLGDSALLTYHPNGEAQAPILIHAESWSDMVMIQSGHGARENPGWEWIERLVKLEPPKPALDGEPNYEDHPAAPWPQWDPDSGYFRDYEVRKQVYRSVFAGACGVTYGHHSMWQCAGERYEWINHADRSWKQALERPGAEQMAHLKNLMLSRPYFNRIPDQGLVASDAGTGGTHLRATRAADGSYALLYFPNAGQRALIDLSRLSGAAVKASWYSPRSGKFTTVGEFPAKLQAFTSPVTGIDWVLVVDPV